MRYFRRLPPLLRVASIVGLLFVLTDLALLILLINSFVMDLLSSSPHASRGVSRVGAIALNLSLLSLACSIVVNSYSRRFRQPDRGPFPLGSWQSQVRAILLLSALPLCAITLALFIPPTFLAFGVVFLLSLLALFVLFVWPVAALVGAASSGPMRTPPIG
jgi:hypothetical protein